MKYKYLVRLLVGFIGGVILLLLNKFNISVISIISYIVGIIQVESAILLIYVFNGKTEDWLNGA